VSLICALGGGIIKITDGLRSCVLLIGFAILALFQ
jgi:hypothetical protein